MIFWDACAAIYFVDNNEPWVEKLVALVKRLDTTTGHAISQLSLLECRIKPLREQNTAVLAAYDRFFSRNDLLQVPLSKEIVLEAARIRALHNLKTPDALQAASALSLPGDVRFLTSDPLFERVRGLHVALIE